MYKTILVPLDGSARAEAILRHVQEMALRYKSKVVLMQVVEPNLTQVAAFPDAGFFYKAELESLTKEAEQYLAGKQGELESAGIHCAALIGNGPTVRAILDAADKENADLIALASHGRTGFSRFVYGSVAAGILHQSNRPLLMVRAE